MTSKCIPVGVCHAIRAELHFVKSDTVKLEIENVSDAMVSGVCNLATPAGVTVAQGNVPFRVQPKARAEIVFELGNVAKVTTREHLKAVVRYGGEETVAHELLQPPVLNGSFEQCTAQDGWPDYWNYRAPEQLYYQGIALDTTTCVEGKQSLRIDPYDRERTNHLATTLMRLVPNTRYRIRCSIRRSADVPGIGLRLFSMDWNGKKASVDVYLGNPSSGQTNVWERFVGEFTTGPKVVPHEIVLSNSTQGAATVWYDAIHIEEVQ